jgi:phosphocarrier protein HPr
LKTSEVLIKHPIGLHARPAKTFVQTAQKFSSKVTVTYKEKTVNAKSLLGLLSLGVSKDAAILIHTDGEDEGDAMLALETLVNTNFGE